MARQAASAAPRPGTSSLPPLPLPAPPADPHPAAAPSPLTVSASPVGRRVRVPKTAELVASQLRRRIIRGELTEGDALPPEPTLMAQFGVSRPTLREAFRVLEAEVLISVRRGAHGGARVHAPSPAVAARYAGLVLEHRGATLGDVHQACALLEPPCAGLLAERANPGDVAALRRILADGDAVPEDAIDVTAAQAAFHLAVVELTGNKSLAVLTGILQNLVEMTTVAHGQAAAPPAGAPAGHTAAGAAQPSQRSLADRRSQARATRQVHATLIDLVESGDAARATEHWQRHLAAPGHAIPGGPADRCMLDLLG